MGVYIRTISNIRYAPLCKKALDRTSVYREARPRAFALIGIGGEQMGLSFRSMLWTPQGAQRQQEMPLSG